MILGGLKEGVTPLDMAHAYETFATGGNRVFNPRARRAEGGPDRDRRRSSARPTSAAARA